MSIPISTVRQMAQLACLGLNSDELSALSSQLGHVLGFVSELSAADVTGVEPMAHPLDVELFLRADEVSETNRRVAFLALAPETQSGLYLVPKVID